MNQNPEPGTPVPPGPSQDAAAEAYRHGYLAGHLAGWRDALAAQAVGAQAGIPPRTPSPKQAHVQAPAVQTQPAPPNVIPQRPAYGGRNSMPPRPAPAPAGPFAPQLAAQPQRQPQLRQPQQRPQDGQLPGPVPGVVPPPSALRQDPAGLAARKAKRETQNINITLYVASLLMVAAAALFVGSNLPVAARLVGVWLGTSLFYAAGLILHGRVARLRPAAVAFTGTGLAIVPFAGIASYTLGFPDAPGIWFATSLIGTAAYAVAAVRLQSRLVVYLSVAFLLSAAWSSVAIVGAALAWYFAALIVFSAVLSLMGNLLARRGRGKGSAASLYAKPLKDLGPWFAPTGLAGSLVVGTMLDAGDHLLVLLAGVVHFAIMLPVAGPAARRWNFLGLRASLTLAALFAGWLVQPSLAWAAGVFTVVLAAQIVAVAHSREPLAAYLGSGSWIRWDVHSGVPAVAAGGLSWSIGLELQATQDGANGFAVWGLAFALVAAMAVVPTFLPRGEWLPLPAVLAVVLFSPALDAGQWTVLLAISLAYAVVRFAGTAAGALKQGWLVAARLLVTALAASSLAAFVPPQPGKAEWVIAAIAVLAALQLLADTLLAGSGAANPATGYSAASWAVVGTSLVVALTVATFGGFLQVPWATGSLGTQRAAFLMAAAAMGLSTVGHSAAALRRSRAWAPAELVAPLFGVIVALAADLVFHATGACVAWMLTTAYFLAVAALLRTKPGGLHRQVYWWSARASSLVLAAALFQWWAEFDPATRIAGAHVSMGTVLLVAFLPQLAVLTAIVLSGRRTAGLDADIAVTLCLLVVVTGSGLPGAGSGLWPAIVAVGAASAGMAALMAALGMAGGPLPAAQFAAPASLLFMALWSVQDTAQLAIVLGIIGAGSAVVAARAGTLMLRSVHFLLARAAVTVLAGVLADWLSGAPAVVTLVLCAALVVQLPVQLLATRTAGTEGARVGEPTLLAASLWLLLAGLLAMPFAYVAATGGFSAPGTAWRAVALVELAVLGLTAILTQVLRLQRGASYLALAAVMGSAAVVSLTLWPGATALALLAVSLGLIAWRCLHTPETAEMRWYWLVGTVAMLITAHLVDGGAAPGIFAAMWLVAGLALLAGTQLMELKWLTLPGALLVFLAAVFFRSQVLNLTGRPGFSALAGFLLVMATLYVVRLVLLDLVENTFIQRSALVPVAVAGGAFFALWSMLDTEAIIFGAAAFTVAAALACLEAPAGRRRVFVDAAVVVCAAVWFWACSAYVDLGPFWAVQWCAMALGGLSVIRYVGKAPQAGKGLLMAAAVLASLGAVMTIFSGDTVQQLVSLLVFVALLAVGMSLGERVFTIWGAVGVATAVLWYLRGFTFLLLAVLALTLIGFAIWRLNRKNPHDAGAGQPLPEAGAPDGQGQQSPPLPAQPPQLHYPPVPPQLDLDRESSRNQW